MKLFYAGIGLAAVALAFMSMQWRGGGGGAVTSFYGVVDTAETVVSAELPVEILRLHVVPGQMVNAGDPLVDLSSGELERNIAELRYSLNETRAARLAEDREIQAQVAEYEAQYKLNRTLLRQVRGERGFEDDRDEESPLRAAIHGLKGLLEREELSTVDMEAYLSLLLREREKLTVVASAPGLIGTVYRRVGEKVKAFEPVLTLYTGAPVTVRGYIHESAHGAIRNGQKVRVRSLASRYDLEGEVVGIGHRIVEYPVRLRKRPDIQMWGREVIVRIPDANAFLLGEKVMIEMERHVGSTSETGSRTMFPGMSAHASGADAEEALGSSPRPVASEWTLPGVEASGLIYLPDVRRFLVISDDTPQKRPWLHVVAPDGAVEGTTEIQGLEAINDMEGIAQDALGRVYVATSQSHNKSGKFPRTRRLLVRAVRTSTEGTALKLDASVVLHDVLVAVARNHSAEWAEWFRAASDAGTLDMEGIALQGSGLLLGFKAPLWRGRAVILHVHDRDGLFAGKPLTADGVSLWDAPALTTPDGGAAHGISDLFLRDGVLHVLGTAVRENSADGVTGGGGGWWTLERGKTPRFMRAFPGMKPEGIAWDPHAAAWRIALDEGGDKPSRVLVVRPSAP